MSPNTVARSAFWLVFVLGCGPDSPETSIHPAIQLGESLEALRPLFEEGCGQTEELHYTGEMAAPFHEQIQINCSGLDVLGARRDAELMFNDGPLGHVWILIGAEEVGEMQTTLEKTFGPVVYKTESDRVFMSGTVALRLEPPEVLIATPELITALTGYREGER